MGEELRYMLYCTDKQVRFTPLGQRSKWN